MATSFPQIDSPGSWHFFSGYGPIPLGGHCAHDCKHMGKSWIAYGPDLEHYTLDECGGCMCRAWHNADGKRRGAWLSPAAVQAEGAH